MKNIKRLAALFAVGFSIIGFAGGCSGASEENELKNEVISSNHEARAVEASEEELANAPFEITVLNTKNGAADAILVKIEDKYILIDSALNDDGKRLRKLIESKGTETLDYFIISHFDKDHIGGADKIINKLSVNNLIQPDYTQDSKQYEQLESAIIQNNINNLTLKEDMSLDINGAKINIYPAREKSYKDVNNYSIIIEIQYGDYNYLFPGDANEKRLNEFLEEHKDVQYTFVKMPHHGRENNLTAAFLQSVSPEYAVITSSEEEPADTRVLTYLEKLNTKTFLTTEGTVVLKSDGKKINISQITNIKSNENNEENTEN